MFFFGVIAWLELWIVSKKDLFILCQVIANVVPEKHIDFEVSGFVAVFGNFPY